MTEPGSPIEISGAHLMVLRQALLEVATGTASAVRPPSDAARSNAVLAWLIQATGTSEQDQWTLTWDAAATATIRRLDDAGGRFVLSASQDVMTYLARALRDVRSELLDFEVPIRLRAPVEQVDEIQRRLHAHLA
jgi:hypothetical protein